mmetsp:Transcript_4729/g.16631  ORF Transcript_4729/g.16631 Transcript_4729/m.16631 type:complete len:289 (-) Transcript_4729:245-1111(-)
MAGQPSCSSVSCSRASRSAALIAPPGRPGSATSRSLGGTRPRARPMQPSTVSTGMAVRDDSTVSEVSSGERAASRAARPAGATPAKEYSSSSTLAAGGCSARASNLRTSTQSSSRAGAAPPPCSAASCTRVRWKCETSTWCAPKWMRTAHEPLTSFWSLARPRSRPRMREAAGSCTSRDVAFSSRSRRESFSSCAGIAPRNDLNALPRLRSCFAAAGRCVRSSFSSAALHEPPPRTRSHIVSSSAPAAVSAPSPRTSPLGPTSTRPRRTVEMCLCSSSSRAGRRQTMT